MNNQLIRLVSKAKKSFFWLWVFNKVLHRVIPFNAPHKIEVKKISSNLIEIKLPFIKKNKNHLNGMHACALATACEYCCGLLLISRLDPSKYRLIMKTLHMDYLQQAKTEVHISYELLEETILGIQQKLSLNSALIEQLEISAYNTKGEKVCTAKMEWQLKKWGNTRNN